MNPPSYLSLKNLLEQDINLLSTSTSLSSVKKPKPKLLFRELELLFEDDMNFKSLHKMLTIYSEIESRYKLFELSVNYLLPINVVRDLVSEILKEEGQYFVDICPVLVSSLYTLPTLEENGLLTAEIKSSLLNHISKIKIEELSRNKQLIFFENCLFLGYELPFSLLLTHKSLFFNPFLFFPFIFRRDKSLIMQRLGILTSSRIDYLKLALEEGLIPLEEKFFLPIPPIENQESLDILRIIISRKLLSLDQNFNPLFQILCRLSLTDILTSLLENYPSLKNTKISLTPDYFSPSTKLEAYELIRTLIDRENPFCQYHLVLAARNKLFEGNQKFFLRLLQDIESEKHIVDHIFDLVLNHLPEWKLKDKIIILKQFHSLIRLRYSQEESSVKQIQLLIGQDTDIKIIKLIYLISHERSYKICYRIKNNFQYYRKIIFYIVQYLSVQEKGILNERMNLWVHQFNLPSQILTYIVLFSDGYHQIVPGSGSGLGSDQTLFLNSNLRSELDQGQSSRKKIIRWFQILSKLSLYLQIRICQLVYYSDPDKFINTKAIDYWLSKTL